MKKILFLIALFTLFVGANSYAKKDVIYSTGFPDGITENCSYDVETKKFSWTSQYSNAATVIKFAAGTLSNFSTVKLHVDDIETGSEFRIVVKFGSGTQYWQAISATGDITLKISEFQRWGTKITNDEIATAYEIRLSGSDNGEYVGDWVKIDPTSIYLESDEYEAMDITTTINNESTVSTPFQWHKVDLNTDRKDAIENTLGKTTSGTIFGYGSSNSIENGFFDLTGYDKVTVTLASFDGEKSNQVRLLNAAGDHLTFVCTSGTLTYTSATMPTSCTSIKAGAGAGNCQDVSSVVFNKSFNAASTTAFSIAASTSSTISYDRSFTGDQASTVCLPFALTQGECDAAGEFYELTDFDGNTLTFTKVTSGGTTAYKPYLFKATSTGTPFSALAARAVDASSDAVTTYSTPDNGGYSATMTGTLAHQSLADGVYGWNSTSGDFSVTSGTSVTIDAFRAYITVSGSSSARLGTLFVDSSVTGINEVSNSEDVKSVKNFEGKVFENGKIYIFKKGMKFNANGQLIK